MKQINSAQKYINTVDYIKENMGKTVTFKGAVHRVRDMGDFAFVVIRTDTALVQCVFSGEISSMKASDIKDAMTVEITGDVRSEERAENGFEVLISSVEILSKPYDTLPIPLGKKYMGLNLDADLTNRPISLRHPVKKAVFRIQAEISNAFADYMISEGFTKIHTPKIVAAGAEGGANIFKLDYFGQTAYLAQSPQFYKQYMAGVMGRVFEIGSVYRAEKHSTSRHLNEYIGLDFEMAFINDMYDIMAVETGMLKHVVAHLNNKCASELELLKVKLPVINTIPSVTFSEAKELMEEHYGHKSKNKFDLDPDEEKILCKYAEEHHNSEFIFVTHFPSKKRPFYALDDKEIEGTAQSFDLLFRGLEITTGGMRVHDYKEQVAKMEEFKYNPENFEYFLMMHKYGMPPHGGLGLGLERLTMKMLNLSNVRDASLFPRDMTRVTP